MTKIGDANIDQRLERIERLLMPVEESPVDLEDMGVEELFWALAELAQKANTFRVDPWRKAPHRVLIRNMKNNRYDKPKDRYVTVRVVPTYGGDTLAYAEGVSLAEALREAYLKLTYIAQHGKTQQDEIEEANQP